MFVFVGPPGSGKGSLSQLCVQELAWRQISTGNLCRKHIEKQTEIGKEIAFILKAGKLVSDELITRIVHEGLAKHIEQNTAVILDGYPRTMIQAQLFGKLAEKIVMPFHIIIVKFSIDDTVVVERLSSRYMCQNQDCQIVYSVRSGSGLAPKREGICDACGSLVDRRKDDTPEVIRERLRLYYQHEQGLLDFYKKAGYALHEFSSDQPLEQLFGQFREKMEKVKV